MFKASVLLALAVLAAAKPASDSRTYAVDYFYGVGPLTEGRMDPIVAPGGPSNHVHTVMGGSAFAYTMSDDTALSSNCTNSLPKGDLSNYWFPKLYYHDPHNGSFVDVDLYYAKAYYFSEPTDDVTTAFPQGLRMITGDAMQRTHNDKLGQLNIDSGNGTIQSVQFVCGTTGADPWPQQYQGKNGIGFPDPSVGGHGVGFPDANCDGDTTPLRYDLHFPSCYNPAVNRDDYKNNMQFPSSIGATPGRQNCPEGWIHTPHLFIEVYWNTPPFADLWTPGQGSQPFVLAQGDPTGFGLHGDFLSGWIEEDLQAIIDGCDAGDAGMNECPNINSAGGVNDNADRCNIEPADPSEVIHGVLDQLPGCNPLQWGPGEASIQTANCGGVISNTNTATTAAAAATTPPASASAVSSAAAGSVSASASSVAAPALAGSSAVTGSGAATTLAGASNSSSGVFASSSGAVLTASVSAPAESAPTGSVPASSVPVPLSTAGHKDGHTTLSTAKTAQSTGGGFLEGSSSEGGVFCTTVTDYVTVFTTITEASPAPSGSSQKRDDAPRYAHFKRHASKRDALR